jgi:YD repeat-containing protein
MVDVFISYSRRDKEFVRLLHQALSDSDRDTWVDWQDIPLGTAWWQEIQNGIEASDTFIFVISPDSIASKVCTQEIDHAVLYRKRLMPIVRREGFDPELMHPSLSEHNWLFFREQDNFDQAFQALLGAIDTDLNHVRTHTRLLVRAIEWENNGRNDSFLLRGHDLAAAEHWLNQCAEKKPSPAEQHKNYITKSREAENASLRARRMVGIGAGVMGVMLAIAAFAAFDAQQRIQKAEASVTQLSSERDQMAQQRDQMAQQFDQADRNLKQALDQQEEAETRVKAANQKLTVAEQQATAATQQSKLAETQTAQARVAQQQAQTAAQQARVQQQQAQQQAQDARAAQEAAAWLASVTELEQEGAELLQRTSTQFQQIDTLINAMGLGQRLKQIQTSNTNSTRLLDESSTENLLLALRRSVNQVLESNRLPGITPVFSPDEQLIATYLNDTSYLYDRFSNHLLEFPESFLSFSPDGELIAITTFDASDDTGSDVSEVHVYDRSGNRLLESAGSYPLFSPNGELIAVSTFNASDDTGSGAPEVHVYDRSGNRLLESSGSYPLFSPNGELVAVSTFNASDDTGSGAPEVHVYDRSGNRLWKLTGTPSTFAPDTSNPNDQLPSLPMLPSPPIELFSPDGQWIAIVPPEGNRSYVYNLSGDRVSELPGTFLSSSSDGEWIAAIPSGSSDVAGSDIPEVHVYNRSSNRVLELQGGNFAFSPDGELIAITTSNSSDNPSSSVPKVHVYDRSGNRLLELSGSFPSFSPNGELIAITAFNSSDDTSSNVPKVHVYDRSGKRLLELTGTSSTFTPNDSNPNNQLLSPTIELFSPDGQWIATVSPQRNSRYLYNLSNRSDERVAELPGTELRFSPDEELIVAVPSGLSSSYTNVYNRSSERTLQLQGRFYSFSQDGQSIITVSPDGNSSYTYDRSGNRISEFQGTGLISSSQDGQPVVVTTTSPFNSPSSGAYTHIHDPSNNPPSALTGRILDFGPDGQTIATISSDYNSYLYDRSTNRTLELQGVYLFSPYGQPISSFSPDGQLIVTVSPDNISYLYDRSGELIAELQGSNPVFSPDGQFIANSLFTSSFGYEYGPTSDSIDIHSYLYDRSGNRIREFQGNNLIFSPDGQLIATVFPDNTSYLYDYSGELIAELQGNYPSFNSDGQLIVTSPSVVPFGYEYGPTSDSIDIHSYLYDRSGDLIRELQGNYPFFSPDGQSIVTFGQTNNYLYDRSGNRIGELQGNNPFFSPNGQYIVTTSLDSKTNNLYDRFGNHVEELQGEYPTFSPDGQFIATTSSEAGTSTLYDPSNQNTLVLPGRYPSFSPNGQLIATTSPDGATSVVYDRFGKRIAEYPGSDPVFTPDGESLITYVSENRSQLWQLDNGLDDLLAQGCNLLRGYFVINPRALDQLTVCRGMNTNLSPSTVLDETSYQNPAELRETGTRPRLGGAVR